MERSVDLTGRHRVKTDVVLRVFDRETACNCISPPLVIIGIEAGTPALGLSTNDVVMLVTLPPEGWFWRTRKIVGGLRLGAGLRVTSRLRRVVRLVGSCVSRRGEVRRRRELALDTREVATTL